MTIVTRPKRWTTTRGLMLYVFFSAVVSYLSFAAVKVSSAKAFHHHTWIQGRGAKAVGVISSGQVSPFWPRYWRCVLGLKWEAIPVCPQVAGRFLDICEFAHPELLTPAVNAPGRFVLDPTRSQKELLRKLSKQ